MQKCWVITDILISCQYSSSTVHHVVSHTIGSVLKMVFVTLISYLMVTMETTMKNGGTTGSVSVVQSAILVVAVLANSLVVSVAIEHTTLNVWVQIG